MLIDGLNINDDDKNVDFVDVKIKHYSENQFFEFINQFWLSATYPLGLLHHVLVPLSSFTKYKTVQS